MDKNQPNFASSLGRHSDLVDGLCDEFEAAWRDGNAPTLKDYLAKINDNARPQGFYELLRVELEFRRLRGEAPKPAEYDQQFPSLTTQIAEAFAASSPTHLPDGSDLLTQQYTPTKQPRANGSSPPFTDVQLASGSPQQTIDHTPSRKESRGLHIRCPHCNNAVELLADTPFAEISCGSCGSAFNLVDRDESTRMAAPLKTIDRFDLVSRLGVGGFGTVWKARDRELDRVVAVKIPRRGQLSSAEIEQFFREARSAAQLRHPNIVPVHEVGREGETLFIVSDFIRGVAFSDWLTGNRPSVHEAVSLCVPVADALHHAHQNGVIHRDLKPSNIMIDEVGLPHLMDFGLAKREVGEITMTMDGQIVGTPRYMSPEQASGHGHESDRRTDIYSMGVMFFEMLTGDSPFRGNAQLQIHKRLTEDAPDPRTLNRHIPRDLSTICLKCLERDPEKRFATCADLADEFKRFLRGEPIKARPISAPARLIRWAKRKPMVATTGALTIFLAIAGPLVALLIEHQRSHLAELVSEKNNLIDQYAGESRKSAVEVASLNKDLATWKGQANPFELWPPTAAEPPRLRAAEKLLGQAHKKFVDQLGANAFDPEKTGKGYTGLAIMADAVGLKTEAKPYYERARDIWSQLHSQRPADSRYSRALAECNLSIARLSTNTDRDAAAKDLKSARDIYQQLADSDQRNVANQVNLLEAELLSATLAGFTAAQANLVHAEEIGKLLTTALPSDPDDVYQLACEVLGKEPFLSNSAKAPTD